MQHITLIGMSNVGKSKRAKELAGQEGGFAKLFTRIDCDTIIEERLGTILTDLGLSGLDGMATWMGKPYEPQYPQGSRKFMELEEAVMREAVESLKTATASTVVDTTGSVIYISPSTIERLRASTRVIYLEASEAQKDDMFKRYIAEPKPVIWGDGVFTQKPGESHLDALRRCYPELLQSRHKLYTGMAHVVVPYDQHYPLKEPVRLLELAGIQLT